jgi:murein DD-endopeptidase MepM/ murein hydrolase activator NlpD
MVELKGQNTYNRNTYASIVGDLPDLSPASGGSAPAVYQPTVSQETVNNAHVDSIGVSDLSAPKKPKESKPVAAAAPAAPVNKWTGQPHSDESDHSEVVTVKEEKVAQIKEAPAPAKAKPVEKVVVAEKTVEPAESAKPAQVAKLESKGFMWPVSGKKVISAFGPKGGGKVNDGINIASAEGEPVWAAADGEVVYAGNELKGYGNMVLVKHGGGKTTSYAHMSRINVDKYDRVKQGDIIGYVGKTGNVKAPQLHFAIRDGKDPVDPMKYLSRNVAGL